MKIIGDKITIELKAGEALADGDAVYVSAAGEVKKATDANAAKIVGVADGAAAAGETANVVIYGKKKVVADAAISVGDRVIAAATAGRVKTENSVTSAGHNHTVLKTVTTAIGDQTQFDKYGADGAGNAVNVLAQNGVTHTDPAKSSTDTDTVEAGRTLGKALGAAGAAGDSLEILVCLS